MNLFEQVQQLIALQRGWEQQQAVERNRRLQSQLEHVVEVTQFAEVTERLRRDGII